MDSDGATRREGPLTAIEGMTPALAIGDVAAFHVRLSLTDVSRYLGNAMQSSMRWSTVATLAADIPTTRWLHPMVGDTVMPILEGLLGGGDLREVETFPLRITTTEGAAIEWRVSPHYVSGYLRSDVHTTGELLDYLVATPEARILLGRPTTLLDRVSAILRAAPPAGRDASR